MNQLYNKALLLCFLIAVSISLSAQTVVSGIITDSITQEPMAGVNIIVKGSILGTTSGVDGKYNLAVNQSPPFNLLFSYLGFHTEEVEIIKKNTDYNLNMQVESMLGQEVVISASRVEESILKSPVTIEKMDVLAIQQSATPDYYDALANMKGVQVTNSSLTYTSVNTRGFADAQNTRFVQLVDGMDMAEASINVPDGSTYVPGELDAESVELLPGAASALYGPNAFNGIIIMNSKSPFEYQGLSAMVKLGMTNSKNGGSNPMGAYSLRYAKAFNNKLAFKINLYYLGATDWTSNDYSTDRNNPNSIIDLSKNQNFDGLNLYGDETPIDLTQLGLGTIRRTGISENILLDHRRATSVKADAAVHYRINEKTELIGLYHYGAENTIAQVNAKYAYRNGHQQFIKLELKEDHFFIRSYLNIGQAFKSYSLDAEGAYVNEYFSSSKNTWVPDYVTAMLGGIPDIAPGDSTAARVYADRFMIDPATGQYVPSFQDTLEKIRSNYFQHYPPGAKFYDKTYTWHSEIFYNLKQIKWADIILGGNFRQYSLFSNATIFDEAPVDPNDPQRILTNTYGAYTQIAKTIAEKFKLTGSLRYDIMDDFEGHFTPRVSLVYSPSQNHNFRISYQTGFRYPEMIAQFIYFDTGPYIALGGVSSIASRYGVYNGGSWTQSSYDDFVRQGGKLDPTTGEILENPGNVTLETANVGYLKPEHLSSYEIGYKGIIASKLLVDLNYYYSSYTNFIGNKYVYNKVSTIHQGQQIPAGSRLWALYVNSPYTLISYGIGLGLTYNLPRNFVLNGNYNYATFSGNSDQSFLAGFNTPRNQFSVGIGSREVTKNIGFNLNYRYQESFLWESLYGRATMPAYGVLDAQVSYKISSLKTMIKLGGTNLGGKDYRTNFGSPYVGQIYYISLVFDEFMN